jgi:U3 small nucleolar RNA-associated protein 13
MANRVQIKTTFAPAKTIQPIFTRGSVALSQDGRILASCLDDDVLLTDLRTGEELARIEGVRRSPLQSLYLYLTC